MNAPDFYNHMIIAYAFPFKTYKQTTTSTTPRYTFLNGLALLLNGSSQCTVVYPYLKKKTILITRNQPLEDDDKTYFNNFFGLIRQFTEYCLTSNEIGMEDKRSSLESLVFEYNKNKSIKRITDFLFDDAISNLETLSNDDVDWLCEVITYNKLNKGSADYFYLMMEHRSLKNYILKLLEWVKEIISYRNLIKKNASNVDFKIILKFQAISEALYHSEVFRQIIHRICSKNDAYECIQYYLDKVSAHKRSLDFIIKFLMKRTADYGETYKNIQWSFIEPIEDVVDLSEPPSLSFDKIWSDCGLPNDQTKAEFQNEYIKNKFGTYNNDLIVKVCLHSEIRMIDYLIEQNIREINDHDVEIGISKLPCYLCSLYIQELNNKFHRKFYVSFPITHGKIYPNWMFRKQEDFMMKYFIHRKLYEFLTTEIKELQARNRKRSGDSDKQHTEIDDDDVNEKYMARTMKNFINA